MEVDEEPQPVASTSQDAVKPTQSRKRKAAEAKAEAEVKPEKPAAKSKASKSAEAPAPAAKGVKRARPAKEDVHGAKRAKLDEGRMGLRGPHLAAIAAEGGVVLTLGQGDPGQVWRSFWDHF